MPCIHVTPGGPHGTEGVSCIPLQFLTNILYFQKKFQGRLLILNCITPISLKFQFSSLKIVIKRNEWLNNYITPFPPNFEFSSLKIVIKRGVWLNDCLKMISHFLRLNKIFLFCFRLLKTMTKKSLWVLISFESKPPTCITPALFVSSFLDCIKNYYKEA